MEASGKAFVEHWSWAAQKGLMNKNTAAGVRAACGQVLGVLDNWREVDVRTLDVDDTVKRFKNVRRKEFKPRSLEVYGRRFRQALTSYRSYLDDPGGWKPATQQRPSRAEKNGGNERQMETATSGGRPELGKGALVDYPFPLRDGLTVRLLLPRDLKMAEVKRLNAFMTTLAVDFE